MKKLISIVALSLILLCGGVLAGCNDPTGSLSLSFSSEKIEMITTTEKADYVITVHNAGNMEVSFDFGFETSIAKVVDNSVQDLGDGKYSISIAPISAGKTMFKISLRGTAKSIEIPVNISEELQGFSANENLFVVRGESGLVLNTSSFKFIPEDTTQNAVSIQLVENQDLTDVTWQNNTLTVGELCTLDEILFIAKSEEVQNISCNFSVKVVSPIDLSSLIISSYSQSTTDNELFDPNTKLDVYPYVLDDDGNITNSIELVVNDPYLFQKQIAVEYNFVDDSNNSYVIDVLASSGVAGDITVDSPITNKISGFNFTIQSVKITPKNEPHTLKFRVMQSDFTSNFKEVVVKIYVTSQPKEIRVDGQTNLPLVELYHNNQVSTNFRFSVYPDITGAYNEDTYHYAISLYTSNDGTTLIGPEADYTDVSNYMDLQYGNLPFEDFILPDGTNQLKNLKDLTSLLSVKPKQEFADYFVINIACLNADGETLCSNNIFIKIYKGTENFTFSENYEDGIIYLAMPKGNDLGSRYFQGFTFDEGSTIGDLIISPKTIDSLACEIVQDQTVTDTVRLIITPKRVGESEFIIQTQNGRYLTLKVIVIREIDQSDFSLKIEDNNFNSISEFKYKTKDALITMDTLDSITIKGKGSSVYVKEQIAQFNDTNNYSYYYEMSLIGEGADDYFVIDGGKITSKDFTVKDGVDAPVQVQVSLVIYYVTEDLLLAERTFDTPIYFDFIVSAVDYFKSVNITAKTVDLGTKTKSVSVYDKKVLSYTNQNMAEAYIYLDLQKSQSVETYSSSIKLSSWRISAGNIDGKTNKVGSIGYFYSTEYVDGKPANGEDYIGKFVCDISGISTVKSFTITLILVDDTGNRYESFVTISIDEYIDVDSIYLTTPADTIYVDNTDANREVTVNVYVLPTNAMCQDIQVVIESSIANCIAYTQNGNTVTFTYVSGGSGIIRIFPVSKMKTSDTKDEFGNYYYHIALPFISADGKTMETALRISNLEALKNITSNNHYYLDTIIDCKGQEVYIPSFNNGSIRGTFAVPGSEYFKTDTQMGGISNFVVKNMGENSGLFGILGENARLYNLTISGYLYQSTWELAQDTNIGILAGTNKATITDVQVGLYTQTKLTIKSIATRTINVYVGGAVGVNDGNIVTSQNAKISTFMVYMPVPMEINFASNVTEDNTYIITPYVGGVAGLNGTAGTISSTYTSDIVLGMFGINANVNILINADINTGASYLGGLVGDNKGNILGVKAIGEIENGNNKSYVGGLIGTYSNSNAVVSKNTSRVFVRGYNSVSGLIGYISSSTNSNITKNVVQATDDGSRVGFNASLVLRYSGFASAPPIYALSPQTLTASGENINRAETYFTRAISPSIVSGLEKEYYYGDIVCVDDKNFPSKINASQFDAGVQEVITASVTNFVLAIYKKAFETTNQSKINNDIKVKEILDIAGISAKEITLTTDKVSLASLINFGESATIDGTGLINVTISSSLNYNNYQTLQIYLTNYYTEIRAYSDKDLNQSIKAINLVNADSKKVYLSAYASVYNYKNTPVALMANKEVTFECEFDQTIVNAKVMAQEIYLSAEKEQDSQTTVKVYTIYNANNSIYYAVYNEDINAYVFVKEDDLDRPTDKTVSDLTVNVLTGIENIVIGKTTITAEPSDSINFTIEYDSYNLSDYLVAQLQIDNFTYTLSEDGYFIDSMNNRLFKLDMSEPELVSNNHYNVSCSVKMVQEKDNYLNFKNKTIIVKFTSNATGLYDSLSITYSPETITSVLINNYSFEENTDMISPNKYNLTYDESKMLNAGAFSSSGDYNILQVYVYTKLAEFDYVEISMNSGTTGGYMALGKDSHIDTNSVYTSVDGVVTLRIYKADIFDNNIIFDDSEHVLPITIIYSLPTTISENTRVPIEFTFFKVEESGPVVCYQTETRVIAKSAKKVEFTIYDKDTESLTAMDNENGISQVYKVVRGKKYALLVDIVGYTDEEVIFESSNPNVASITNEGGVYYLSISNSAIAYVNPYYEVVITSYGKKIENNTKTESRKFKTSLHIFDFLVDDDNLFIDDNLALRVLTTVDIRDVIADKLAMEYSAYTTQVQAFKESFKTNSKWEIISNGITLTLNDSINIATANYQLNGYNLKPLLVTKEAPYVIRVSYTYTYKKGAPTCSIENRDTLIIGENTFDIEVYINSNEDMPLPIYSYEDMLNMNDDEYYRLVGNITIKGSEFEMITAKPLGFDGNGYTISIIGDTIGANVQNVTSFALFETIKEKAVFKNIKIVISGRKEVQIDNTYSASGVNIGILTAMNNGIITNCSIVSEEILYVNLIATVNVMENSYFGTLCAVNNGYISNSRIEANISIGGASIGGLVASNTGKIVSSYVKNSRIANTSGSSNENIVTGGFVCINQGEISMSYVEGLQNANKIYADYTAYQYGIESKILYTSSAVGGFVYQNTGDIYDSYANIPIVSSSRCAGFVAINEGNIERVMSLSKMKQRDTLNYAFVTSYTTDASFKDCFFILEPGIINDFTSESNYVEDEEGNYVKVIDGVEPLSISQFSVTNEDGSLNTSSPFANFIISPVKDNTTGIWFYTYDEQKAKALASSLITYTTDVDSFSTYNIDTKEYNIPSFVAGRLQLVSANTIASSRYSLNVAESNKEESEYRYSVDDEILAEGSKQNPYIITDAQDFETYANQRNTGTFNYYRLVCDIDYIEDGIYSSTLTNKTLVAYFEGNNFEVSNYTVNNKTSYISAGLFAQIGSSSSQKSTIKNITFMPSYVNLPNSAYVGAVAGSIANAVVYNISLEGKNVVIAGKNTVGGVFGRTYDETTIRGVYSNVVAKSSQYDSGLFVSKHDVPTLYSTIKYNETGSNRTSVSYAGAIIGFVGGSADVRSVSIGVDSKAYGAIAGLLFGGIGALGGVRDIDIELNSYVNEVKAYAFGGILAGESRGFIDDVSINSDILHKKLFSCYPILPSAIGGIAGIVSGGTIKNISSTEGYSVIGSAFTNAYGDMVGGFSANTVNNPYVVKYVGGIAGYAVKVTIANVDICSEDSDNGLIVSGSNYVGGLVGYAQKATLEETISLNLTGHKEYTNEDGNEIDEMVYTSYVSEASMNQMSDMVFSTDQYFGLLIGFSEDTPYTNGAYQVKVDNIYLYYADYAIKEKNVSSFMVYFIGSNPNSEFEEYGYIKKTFKNLTGSFEKTLTY